MGGGGDAHETVFFAGIVGHEYVTALGELPRTNADVAFDLIPYSCSLGLFHRLVALILSPGVVTRR